MPLSEYERKAIEEVEKYFKQPEEGPLGRLSRALFKPVEVLTEKIIPDAVLEAAGDGIEVTLKGITAVSDKTVTTGQVLTEARRLGIAASTVGDLRTQELQPLDQLSRAVASQNSLMALMEGAGCGLGGIALLAADIPLLFGIAFRVVRLVGCSYGVDPNPPHERIVAYKIFELAAGGTRDRYGALLELDALQDELDGLDSQERAEKAVVLSGLIASRQAVKRIVSILMTRKLGQLVPIAGAAVGAGFNYMFVSDISECARQVYRRRFLADKLKRDEPVKN
ncbi:MAG TPA: EcsC family protein [Planctomycetota bacterium]|nr:EcsC family protein [Planctomycetota bacterium]